jgi:hypothetical protein
MAGLLISHYKSNHAGPQDRSMVHAKVLIEQISASNKFSCGHSHSLQTAEPPLDQQRKWVLPHIGAAAMCKLTSQASKIDVA